MVKHYFIQYLGKYHWVWMSAMLTFTSVFIQIFNGYAFWYNSLSFHIKTSVFVSHK